MAVDRKNLLKIVKSNQQNINTKEKNINIKETYKASSKDIESAKKYALEEMNTFSNKVDDLIAFMKQSALFDEDAETVYIVLKEALLKNFTEQVVKGNQIPTMTVENFQTLQKSFYKKLILKYILKKGE